MPQPKPNVWEGDCWDYPTLVVKWVGGSHPKPLNTIVICVDLFSLSLCSHSLAHSLSHLIAIIFSHPFTHSLTHSIPWEKIRAWFFTCFLLVLLHIVRKVVVGEGFDFFFLADAAAYSRRNRCGGDFSIVFCWCCCIWLGKMLMGRFLAFFF